MTGAYDKVIIGEVEDEKKYAIIFDEKTHTPVAYSLNKLGMDEMLELINNK